MGGFQHDGIDAGPGVRRGSGVCGGRTGYTNRIAWGHWGSPSVLCVCSDQPTGLTLDETSPTPSSPPTSMKKQTTCTYEQVDQYAESATQTLKLAVGTSAALLGDRTALIAMCRATGGPNWTNSMNWPKSCFRTIRTQSNGQIEPKRTAKNGTRWIAAARNNADILQR